MCFCYNFFGHIWIFLAIFYEGYVRVILNLLVPYPGLHPYNGGFNLASGLLFISCNTQLHKTTFSDIQMLSGFSFILCKSQLLKHLLRHTYTEMKRKAMELIFTFNCLIHIISKDSFKIIAFIFYPSWTLRRINWCFPHLHLHLHLHSTVQNL